MTFSTYEKSINKSSIVWLTPPSILDLFPLADTDPCAAPEPRPWATAKTMMVEADDGLSKEWSGTIWLNPPYGKNMDKWMKKMALHGQGFAITYARTDTRWFHDWVAPYASAIFFFKGRLKFHRPCGSVGAASTAPHMLIAYSSQSADLLAAIDVPGILYRPDSSTHKTNGVLYAR